MGKSSEFLDTHGTFDLLKAIWIYESCEITWNSQNHKIRSFLEVPGSFFQFFQELYDEVYEKKHSKLEPVDGELVRHVATVSGGPWFFHKVLLLLGWGVFASSKCGCGPMSCVLALRKFHGSILRGRLSGKKVHAKIYIMALLREVDLNGFGCFWLHSQRNATLVVQRMGALVVCAEELSSCFGA